jgi:hypothetical protein
MARKVGEMKIGDVEVGGVTTTTRLVAVAALAPVLIGVGTTGAQAAPVRAGEARPVGIGRAFATYDNTHFTNLSLTAFGLTRSNVVYEPNSIRKAAETGILPRRRTFVEYVRRRSKAPGPVVLDFEDLYLRGSTATARRHFTILWKVAGWAHEAAPGRPIGFYGLVGHTDPAYERLARRLASREDAFFPSLYTFGDDLSVWKYVLRSDIVEARRVNPRLPVYVYLWPQYHEGTPKALQYIPAAHWRYELDAAHRYADGFVVWSRRRPLPQVRQDREWVGATSDFMRALGHR